MGAEPNAGRRQLWLVGGRLLVTTLLLGGALVLQRLDKDEATGDAIVILIATTFATALLGAVAMPRARRPELWAALQLGWDLVLVTGLVYLLGGALSGFSFLYGVVILAAALTLGPRASQLCTAASLMAYMVVGLGLANGWLPSPPGAEAMQVSPDELGLAVLRNIVGLVLVGLLAGGLAERLRRAGGELRAATASAAELSRLNEDIVRSLGSGLAIVDLDGHISRINPAGATILGGDPSAFTGRRMAELLPFDPGHRGRADGTATRLGGASFPVGLSCSPLRSADGDVLGTLVLFQDLTELRQLRDQADRAERLAALGRLSAGLAHEIRNPLGSISGSVELVCEAPELGEEDRRLLSLVLNEVDRLNDLVTTMLDVGRPRAPELVPVDLGALADEVRRVAEARSDARIELARSPEGVPVRADPAQLRQVLWNLIKNALQFTPTEGSVRITVGRDDAGRPHLSVSDDGPGIDAEDLEHVFDMFFSKRRHGVGLGLALVRQIVVAHGGDVRAESGPSGGSTFTVSLPAAPELADPELADPGLTVDPEPRRAEDPAPSAA